MTCNELVCIFWLTSSFIVFCSSRWLSSDSLYTILNFLHPTSSHLNTFRFVYVSLCDSSGTSLQRLPLITLECLLGTTDALGWIMLHVKGMSYTLQDAQQHPWPQLCQFEMFLDITKFSGKGAITEGTRHPSHYFYHITLLVWLTVPMNICSYSICIFNLLISSFTLSRRDML